MPLDPQSQKFLDALALQDSPGWSTLGHEVGRDVFAGLTDLFGTGPDVKCIDDVATQDGVRIRIYRPQDERSPVLMYFHGGGWVLGDIETHDAVCRRIASESGFAVASVDYRRAPDVRYPGASDDCYQATRFVAENATALHVNSDVLAVGGDSAGGNLAAAVALKSRDDSGPHIAGQILIYPVLNNNFETASYVKCAENFGLTRETMMWFWEQYLGDQKADAYAAPPLAESLAGLPPAFVMTAEYDVLCDEGEDFAHRLTQSGVATTLKHYEGMLHGFVHFAAAFDRSHEAVADMAQFLQGLRP